MKMDKAERARINAQGYTILARGPGCWGEGEDSEKAVNRCKKAMGERTRKAGGYTIEVFKAPTTAHVDRGSGSVLPSDRDEDGNFAPIPEYSTQKKIVLIDTIKR